LFSRVTLLFLSFALYAPAADLPEHARKTTDLVHSLRAHVDGTAPLEPARLDRVQAELEEAADAGRMQTFVTYALGPGLLEMDGFRADLEYFAVLSGTDEGRLQLEKLGGKSFQRFFLSLSDRANHIEPAGALQLDELEAATNVTLDRQDAFFQRSRTVEKGLWLAHSALVLAGSFAAILQFQDMVELNQMTPREFITFLGGIWGANAASYWLIWDHFKFIEPARKFFARQNYRELASSWASFSELYPEITMRLVGTAADDKPMTQFTHADAQADAALEGLMRNDSPEATQELKLLLLSSVEDGIHSRVKRLLVELAVRSPHENYKQLGAGIDHVHRVRRRMEWKTLQFQLMRCTVRVGMLAMGIWAFNAAAKWFAPNHVSRWRTVPSAILGAIGGKRIFPLLWAQYAAEALKYRTKEDEAELRDALAAIMELDPSGDVVSRLARYDSKIAAQQLVTGAAADVLAAHPSGEVTKNMWRILRTDLARSSYSGSRVHYLIDRIFDQQRACFEHLLDTARAVGAGWKSGRMPQVPSHLIRVHQSEQTELNPWSPLCILLGLRPHHGGGKNKSN
jgi:hypothetical protein